MPYSVPFVYLRCNGHLGVSATAIDNFSFGLKLAQSVGTPTSGNILAFLNACIPAYKTMHTGNMTAGLNVFLDELTGALVGTDGKYVNGGLQDTQRVSFGTPWGGGGVGKTPYSTALVLSLRTAKSRGVASHGRVYWPNLALEVNGATGEWNTATIAAVANEARTWLNAINAAAETHLAGTSGVSVMSKVGGGTTQPVIQVKVGVRPDRQERRESQVPERYQSATLATFDAAMAEKSDAPLVP